MKTPISEEMGVGACASKLAGVVRTRKVSANTCAVPRFWLLCANLG